MKKGVSLLVSGLLFAAFACTEKEDPTVVDLDAPVIGFAEGRDDFRPMENEVRAASTDHSHVRFSVTDASGIGQVLVDVHNAFDGHSHARINSDFEPLNVKDIYSPTASNPMFRFPEGATFLNVDNSATDIYWAGPTSHVQGNVLAGPYDLVISAVDIHGNQTSFGDDTNYMATFYIERAYAPQVSVTNLHDDEIEGETGQALDVQGLIVKGDHNLSSEIQFVWIRLEEEHDDNGHGHRVTDEFYEMMWGTSSYNNLSGGPLPSTSHLRFEDILSGENAIIVPEGEDHLDLIVWVEDVNGNITQKTYTVHID